MSAQFVTGLCNALLIELDVAVWVLVLWEVIKS